MAKLIWGVIFGSIGLGYIVYGTKQKRAFSLFSGVALTVFPYFVSNTILIVLIGIALMALPFFITY